MHMARDKHNNNKGAIHCEDAHHIKYVAAINYIMHVCMAW